MAKQDVCGEIKRKEEKILNTRSCKAKVLSTSERATLLKKMKNDLQVLPTFGIKPIKQVELYTKWGPLFKKKARAILCPRPSDDIIKKVKNDYKAVKRKSKKSPATVPTIEGGETEEVLIMEEGVV